MKTRGIVTKKGRFSKKGAAAGKAWRILLATVLTVSLCPGFRALAVQSDGAGSNEGISFAQDVSDVSATQGESGELDAPQPVDAPDGVVDFSQADGDVFADALAGGDAAEVDASAGDVASPSAETVASTFAPATSVQDLAPADDESVIGKTETLEYENDVLYATVEAPAGIFPEGAYLEVEEILPVDYYTAETYAEAMTSLSDSLRNEGKMYSGAKMYDIRIMVGGQEFEPESDVAVRLSYKRAEQLGQDSTDSSASVAIDVAHIDAMSSELSMMGANVVTDYEGAVEEAYFVTDSFSYYIVFGATEGGTTEPTNLGDYGWIRFATSGPQSPDNLDPSPMPADRPNYQWGFYSYDSETDSYGLPNLGTEEAYHRILQVRLWKLKDTVDAADQANYDSAHYVEIEDASIKYFWTWGNTVSVDDFEMPDLNFLATKMHRAWDSEDADPTDSLIGTYPVGGWQSSDNTSSDFNVLDIYTKAKTEPSGALRYAVRYIHADGSVTDGSVHYLSEGSVNFSAAEHQRPGEVYSGMSTSAGINAITNLNEANGSGTINYTDDVDLVKVYVYYKEVQPDNATTTRGRYDKQDGEYYTGAKGLYTDKSAEIVQNNDRQFLVNLESWYVDNAASVGMVLDASGSMAWTAGVPATIEKTAEEWDTLLGDGNWENGQEISWQTLNNAGVVEIEKTDNSSMGYNGYHYYIYDERNTVMEYVALGYTDGNRSNNFTHLVTDQGDDYEAWAYTSRWANSDRAGWYYVNSTGNITQRYLVHGGKSYDGINGGGHVKFYINNNQLWCQFNDGENVGGVLGPDKHSPVYTKRDKMFTKNEVLQDALAQFGAILLGSSPESQIAMTRFSQTIGTGTNFANSSYLPLLNWTSSTNNVTDAMDRTVASGGYTNKDDNGVTVYQYGLTGQTRTWTGVQAYIDYMSNLGTYTLDGTQRTVEQANNLIPSDNSKYLVIFTDGKDTNGDADASGYGETGKRVQLLKNNGYTVITVLMKSLAMDTNGDYEGAKSFLEGLASGGKDGNPQNKLYFEASADSAFDMVQQFREIAAHIVTGLQNYTVRDYIDPRFDVVNEAGTVLSVLDSEGQFRNSTNSDVDATTGLRGFTTPDGKHAYLGYDTTRKMFYVLWQDEDIPAFSVNAEGVKPWKSQIRLQAKEDFMGGNDILTNGNEPNENLVYKPADNDPLTPTTAQKTDANGNLMYDAQGNPVYWERGTFPFASVDPGLLDVKLGNYEDTIYLGEEITPGALLSTMMGNYRSDSPAADERTDTNHRVADTVYNADVMTDLGDTDQSSKWYVEYLERLGKKRHNDINYYGTLLQHVKLTGTGGVQPIIEALKADSNYTVTELTGSVTIEGKANTSAAFEKISIVKTGEGDAKIELELPYYYLDSPTDPTQYAGQDRDNAVDPQDDRVGTVTYKWEMEDFASNIDPNDSKDERNDFVKFDTYVDKTQHMNCNDDVRYQFSMSYAPLTYADDGSTAKDGNNDGSNRTKALTGQTSVAQPLIRDAVGTERTSTMATTDEMGWAVVHAVDGRMLVEKKMLTTELDKAKAHNITATMSFTLTGTNITSAPADEDVWTKEFTFDSSTTGAVDGEYTVLFSEWVTGLPEGTYTLNETVSGGLALDKIEGVDNVQFWDDTGGDPANPYSNSASNFAVSHSGSTWTFGSNPKHTHTDYPASDYTYEKVSDTIDNNVVDDAYKGTDALANSEEGGWAKDYLNAQIGHAIVKNKMVTTSIDVTKTWEGDKPDAPIVVQVSGNDTPQTVYYVELNASNGWSATIEGIIPDGTLYTAIEGTGTVEQDGSCSNFASFSTTEAYLHGDNYYKFVSLTYKNKDGAERTGDNANVQATDAPKAGSIEFVNKEITQLTVEKKWEGVTPTQPIVVKVTGSDGGTYYTQLGTDTWTYTFKDLPAKTGLTYTVDEGTGTVADGACTDFALFATSGTFTFDGKTYQRKSLEYFDANSDTARDSANLDGSKSPDAGKAVFTNEALTKVEVEKAWDDLVETADRQPIYVQLYKKSGDAEPVAVGDPVQLSSSGWSTSFDNLKVEAGVTYEVKEGQREGSTFVPYDGTFTMNGKKMHQQGLEIYADANKTTEADVLNGSVSPYGGKAVITNAPVLAEIKVLKVEAADNTQTVDGVTFTLLVDADTPTSGNPTYDKTADTTPVTGADGVETADGGKLALPKLAPGAYWLLETGVPEGYVMRDADHPIGIVVSDEGVVTLVSDSTFVGNMVPVLTGPTDGVYQLQVPNMRTYALPAAGGLGELPFLFLGAFVAALAAAGFRTWRRPLAAAHARPRNAHGRR